MQNFTCPKSELVTASYLTTNWLKGSCYCSIELKAATAMYQQIQALNTEEKALEINKIDIELFKMQL